MKFGYLYSSPNIFKSYRVPKRQSLKVSKVKSGALSAVEESQSGKVSGLWSSV